MGAHRFTDLETNTIIASTDLEGLSKSPIDATEKREHYSQTTWGQWVWGSTLVYKDNLVSNEVVTLALTVESIDSI